LQFHHDFLALPENGDTGIEFCMESINLQVENKDDGCSPTEVRKAGAVSHLWQDARCTNSPMSW
jgi:hypothetical protein